MFYASFHNQTNSHHICIWREIKRHLQYLYKHSPYSIFWKIRSAHFLTTVEPRLNKTWHDEWRHCSEWGYFFIENKASIQQIQSQKILFQSDNILTLVQEMITFLITMFISELKLRLSIQCISENIIKSCVYARIWNSILM